jgi:hypothetical protein
MFSIDVWHASRGPGACRSCGARIEWATVVASGKKMPFDAPVHVVSAYERDGKVIDTIDPAKSPSHFATCPDAHKWRKRGARR